MPDHATQTGYKVIAAKSGAGIASARNRDQNFGTGHRKLYTVFFSRVFLSRVFHGEVDGAAY